MRPFDYFEPATLPEAVSLLERFDGRASILAGGTDLLVEIKERIRLPDHVINIKKVPGLDYLSYDPVDGLKIGSLATLHEVETSPVVIEKYAGLYQAARELGSIQVRNRATVAGNICRASPSADTLPPLIADNATIHTFGPDGERSIPMEKFFTGPGKTVLLDGEILTRINVPSPPPNTGKVYLKLGRRAAMELATVGVAVTLTLDGNECRSVRIVLGAVAPTPMRATDAEDILIGKAISENAIEEASQAAKDQCRPISDVRGSADYRREMVRVLTGRALRMSIEAANEGNSPFDISTDQTVD